MGGGREKGKCAMWCGVARDRKTAAAIGFPTHPQAIDAAYVAMRGDDIKPDIAKSFRWASVERDRQGDRNDPQSLVRRGDSSDRKDKKPNGLRVTTLYSCETYNEVTAIRWHLTPRSTFKKKTSGTVLSSRASLPHSTAPQRLSGVSAALRPLDHPAPMSAPSRLIAFDSWSPDSSEPWLSPCHACALPPSLPPRSLPPAPPASLRAAKGEDFTCKDVSFVDYLKEAYGYTSRDIDLKGPMLEVASAARAPHPRALRLLPSRRHRPRPSLRAVPAQVWKHTRDDDGIYQPVGGPEAWRDPNARSVCFLIPGACRMSNLAGDRYEGHFEAAREQLTKRMQRYCTHRAHRARTCCLSLGAWRRWRRGSAGVVCVDGSSRSASGLAAGAAGAAARHKYRPSSEKSPTRHIHASPTPRRTTQEPSGGESRDV